MPPCRPPLFSSSSTILDTRPPPRSNIALRKLLINSTQPKIAAGPKNSRQGWFPEPEVILVIEALVEEEALVEARSREG